MTKFTDRAGGEWGIDLTNGMVEKVIEDADFDFDAILARPDDVFRVLLADRKKFGQIMWALCGGEAESRGVEPRAFGFLFDRATIDRATDALVAELVLFYQRSSAGETIIARFPEILAKWDRDTAAGVGERLTAYLSGTPTGSPGSAESPTPAG
jgi:hypothetical protein